MQCMKRSLWKKKIQKGLPLRRVSWQGKSCNWLMLGTHIVEELEATDGSSVIVGWHVGGGLAVHGRVVVEC